jgi:hypothetical protein
MCPFVIDISRQAGIVGNPDGTLDVFQEPVHAVEGRHFWKRGEPARRPAVDQRNSIAPTSPEDRIIR